MTDGTKSEAVAQALTEGEKAATEDLIEAAAEVAAEIERYLATSDSKAAAGSLDKAIGSMGRIEHENVSSIQLVAL